MKNANRMNYFKTIAALLFAALIIAPLQAQGIDFAQGSWEEILVQAEKEDKPIFLDAYASWCGPCKRMTGEVFPQEEVGDFYNENFINVKIDMEKGIGPKLAGLYEVEAYPTYLFFDSKGELVHKSRGMKPAADFIRDGRDAMNERTQLVSLGKKYAAGDHKTEILRDYALALTQSGAPVAMVDQVSVDYFEKLDETEMSSPEVLSFLYETATRPSSFAGRMLLEHKEEVAKEVGQEELDQKFLQLASVKTLIAARQKKAGDALAASGYLNKAVGERAAQFPYSIEMLFAELSRDWRSYGEETSKHLAGVKSPAWNDLNSVAWNYYLHLDEPAQTDQAISWVEQSISLESNYYNLDTYAALLMKKGNAKKAKKIAKKAIKVGQQAGEDVSGTQELLEKISKG